MAGTRALWIYGVSVGLLVLLGGGLATAAHWRETERKRQQRRHYLLGAEGVPVRPPVVARLPAPAVPFSSELFSRLTRQPWLERSCAEARRPSPGASCARLDLRGDGTYQRDTAIPDEVIAAGYKLQWDLRATSETSGIIALWEGTLLPFELSGEGLLNIEGRTYRRDPAPAPSRPPPAAQDFRPPPLPILQAFEELVSTAWIRRQGEFGPYWSEEEFTVFPERVSFHPDGSFEATYQRGDCIHRGTFAVTTGTLVPSWKGNRCGPLPPASSIGTQSFRWMEQGKLGLQLVFYPASPRGEPGQFFIDPHNAKLTLEGQLSGKLRKGVPTELRLTLRHGDDEYLQKKLGALSLTLRQRVSRQALDGGTRGPPVLVSKDLGGRPFDAWNHVIEDKVVLTPEFTGPAELRIGLGFEDPLAPHRLDRTYFVEVEE